VPMLFEQSPLMALFPQNAPPEVDPEYWADFCKRRQEAIQLRKRLYDLEAVPMQELQVAAMLVEVRERMERIESHWMADHDELMDIVLGDPEVAA